MKTLLLILLLWPTLAFAGTSNVTFEWDANSEPDLAGYRLYQSTTPGVYSYGQGNEVADISAGTMVTTINSTDGTFYWVLTAYDNEGLESGPSNEVTAFLDATGPDAPSGFTITIIIKLQ